MSTLLCPDCGHDIEKHRSAGCHVVTDYSTGCFCDCSLTGYQAIAAAQRAAAIAHLREIGGIAKRMKAIEGKYHFDEKNQLREAIAAYRAVEILPKPKERKP